jgi:hypothetical protein
MRRMFVVISFLLYVVSEQPVNVHICCIHMKWSVSHQSITAKNSISASNNDFVGTTSIRVIFVSPSGSNIIKAKKNMIATKQSKTAISFWFSYIIYMYYFF